ncbi:MAG: cytochrome C oxidase subunit IV family protein [Microscillaceae bacterium]|nr:cytochrome C oxidase subunit IV family protein [Microscillaceae bacterium]
MAEAQKIEEGQIPKPNTAWIWRTFWILFAVTVVEFIIALALPLPKGVKVSMYIFLTIVKAGYIIGEFMHLKYEVRFLLFAILLPMVFVVWLVGALIVEGGSIFYSAY